ESVMKLLRAATIGVCGLSMLMAVPVRAADDDLGGKLTFAGGLGLSSPCVPENLNANAVDVSMTASANVAKNRENATVQVRFRGPAPCDHGGTYDVSGAASVAYSRHFEPREHNSSRDHLADRHATQGTVRTCETLRRCRFSRLATGEPHSLP